MTKTALFLDRYGSVVAVSFVLVILLGLVAAYSRGGLDYFDAKLLVQGGVTLALAAIGATLVILSGGFDLSVGAVISLTNVVGAIALPGIDGVWAFWLSVLISVAVGSACGLVNGLLIAFGRLQSIVVTLSTMFIIQGVTLLVMDAPGGQVPPVVSDVLMGDTWTDVLPSAASLILIVMALWAWCKRTPYGLHLYAVGGHPAAARATGVPVRRTLLLTYVGAGALYGLAGLFLSAQTGSGDPLVGNSLLLSVFAAVVIGGTRLGGGRGGPTGSVIGAYVLMIIVNLLLVFNVAAYYSTIVQGMVLILAIMLGSLGAGSPLRASLEQLFARATRLGRGRSSRKTALPPGIDVCADIAQSGPVRVTLRQRYGKDLRISLPAWVVFVLVAAATAIFLGRDISQWSYWNSLIVLSTFLIVLALGQGAVIFTGGLDLSLPWAISLCAFLFTGMAQGSNEGLLGVAMLAILAGVLIGLGNGIMVAFMGFSPIVATLAMNGILQGIALLYSQGTPSAFPPPFISWVMTGRFLGMTPVIPLLLVFVVLATVLLTKTAFGRSVYATGSNAHAAFLSGVSTRRVLVLVYVLSGACAAVAGILLSGFSGQASLGMGDDYLLPSIAVIVLGGGLITGGRGHFLGILAGVFLLTSLQMLLTGSGLPYAARPILFGIVVLAAVATLRERA
ncbi:ABC transporter permease [Castellaniella caeni]|uniref:ABC transporter permease n=1 Tax=Castellaniella caeni TaxID=266123 RepID=UPI001CA4812D|nr:ABC transporter permease [Castellaniella caeni]